MRALAFFLVACSVSSDESVFWLPCTHVFLPLGQGALAIDMLDFSLPLYLYCPPLSPNG